MIHGPSRALSLREAIKRFISSSEKDGPFGKSVVLWYIIVVYVNIVKTAIRSRVHGRKTRNATALETSVQDSNPPAAWHASVSRPTPTQNANMDLTLDSERETVRDRRRPRSPRYCISDSLVLDSDNASAFSLDPASIFHLPGDLSHSGHGTGQFGASLVPHRAPSRERQLFLSASAALPMREEMDEKK
ncbi:hypothetical protein SISNIDRAFT_488097 [Sistotremastrum niveocremeum HHB9708]|uniref:Uncharacterized protein n=1 Tax=Sistotremastrum niveocremeum HHB9708 TaxID=1314777 RepID=A0A164RRB9_9AGAM|nr:hypothetical protein SISNIDRAFT_488097 [Sistotremastrum niveocremeum HHB9708]